MRQRNHYNSRIEDISSPLNENMEIGLISEYIDRIKAGEHPKPEEYMARYGGPRKDLFEEKLYFATFLEEIFRHFREEAIKILTPERMKVTKKLILEKVLTELHKNKRESQKVGKKTISL